MDTEDLERSLVSPRAAEGEAGLIVVHSPDETAYQAFHALDPVVTLGRRDEGGAATVQLADTRISREHAEVRWRADGRGCEVRDLKSRNGTFVDGRRVTSDVAPLGAVLRVGDSFFEVAIRPPELAHPLFVGRSAALARLVGDVRRAATSDANVLVEGETGTGKELVAEALHQLGGAPGKLVAINCASIPPAIAESFLFGHRKGAFTGATQDSPGVFEQSHDGTLFLDELGELRADLQAKLLRVLETRQFTPLGAAAPRTTNARFVSATNARLRVQVQAGTFRADLFARVAGLELSVPPLRQRKSDIPILMTHFLVQQIPGAKFVISANAMETLLNHDWPMNVRELRAIAGRLALAHPEGGTLRSADVAAVLQSSAAEAAAEAAAPASATVPSRAELTALLQTHGGNVVKLAAHYGKDRKQIYRWLEQHGLDPRDFRG